MAVYNSLLKVSDLKFSDPSPDFVVEGEEDQADIHFSSITKGESNRSLLLKIYGAVQSPLLDSKYGQSVFIKPNESELENLESIEKHCSDHFKTTNNSRYKFKETLNKDYQLPLKLKSKNDKYVFKAPFTMDNAKDKLVVGTPVLIEVTPGVYFSNESNNFGVYYTLKSIEFVEEKSTGKKVSTGTQTKRGSK